MTTPEIQGQSFDQIYQAGAVAFQRAGALDAESQILHTDASRRLRIVKNAIASGQLVTGNPVYDSAIYFDGYSAGALIPQYEEAGATLKGKTGELALRDETFRFDGYTDRILCVGMLDGEELTADLSNDMSNMGGVHLPTSFYIFRSDKGETLLARKRINANLAQSNTHKVGLAIGNEEVKKWLEANQHAWRRGNISMSQYIANLLRAADHKWTEKERKSLQTLETLI